MISKDDCILKYKEYKRIHGNVPKFKEFRTFAGITERDLVRLYGRDAFAKLQRECGDAANKLTLERAPRDGIMKQYGELAKKLGALPNTADWLHQALTPTSRSLARSPHFIKWSDFPQLFADWVSAEKVTDFDKVIQLIQERSHTAGVANKSKDREFETLIKNIRSWSPARRRTGEEGYKVELRGHLKSLRYEVNEEHGESKLDLLIDRTYAIELKKEPSLSEYDRLFGQLARHLQNQKRVIALIFDVPREDSYRQFTALVDEYFNKEKNTVEVMKK